MSTLTRLMFALVLSFCIGKNAEAQGLCKLDPGMLSKVQPAIETAKAETLDSSVEKNKLFEGFWTNGTCTALFFAKEGISDGKKKASVVYIQNRSAADQKVEHHVVPVQSDGSFSVTGINTCRPEPQVRFVPEGDEFRAWCSGYSLLIKKKDGLR